MKQTKTTQQAEKTLKILVVGATGGSGRAVACRLASQGHTVTAFSRTATASMAELSPRVLPIDGDATNPNDVDRAVRGHDAVVVTLGIAENPLRVRLFGSSSTASDVRSEGTRLVIEAMRRHGVPRLVVQSTFGIGATAGLLRFVDQLFFNLLLKPQILDTEKQEALVRESGIDWVLVQPVHLTSDESDAPPFISTNGEVRNLKVARQSLAQFLATATHADQFVGQSVSVSG